MGSVPYAGRVGGDDENSMDVDEEDDWKREVCADAAVVEDDAEEDVIVVVDADDDADDENDAGVVETKTEQEERLFETAETGCTSAERVSVLGSVFEVVVEACECNIGEGEETMGERGSKLILCECGCEGVVGHVDVEEEVEEDDGEGDMRNFATSAAVLEDETEGEEGMEVDEVVLGDDDEDGEADEASTIFFS